MKILIKADTQPTSGMTVGEFIDQVKQIYNEYFPNSECVAQNRKIMGLEYLMIRWYISKDISEVAHNIRDNDMLHITFNIDLEDNTESGRMYNVSIYDNSNKNDMPMPGTITLEVQDNMYFIAPENQYLAYSHRKLPFRKTTGTPEKILSTLKKYAEKLHGMLADDLANGVIHKEHEDLVRSKL